MFQWDPEKAQSNLRKHAVSFEEATTLFANARTQVLVDKRHSTNESRWIAIGASRAERVLAVVFTIRRADGDKIIRIISARAASQKERTALAAITGQSD